MSSATSTDLLAGTWNFVPVHSSAEFAVQYLVVPFRARFDRLEADLADGRLSGSVEAASVQAKDDALTAHLQAPDFFDAERYPELSFESSAIRIEDGQVELDGELTIKGVTRPLHATGTVAGPAEDPMGNTRLGFELSTTIDRTDYGIDFNMELPGGGDALSNEVELLVTLEFHRAV
jgi:polyisoprenoid-binding protein YceI